MPSPPDGPVLPSLPADPIGPALRRDAPTLVSQTAVEPRGPGALALPASRERFGHYVILDELGAGAMGVVLSAYDHLLDRKVALKLLRAAVHDSDEGVHRMRREAQAMARLSHPNVAQVYEAGEVDGHLFLAMEFVDGVTLRAWLTDRRRPWPEVLAVFLQAGQGLAAAHAAGITHRDFKPDNVMVGVDGRVRVLDFGLSRGRGGASSRPQLDITRQNLADIGVTAAGSMLGTPAYMSPEQFLGHEADARSDQFGFCVALWEGLHGWRPFSGADVQELKKNVLTGRLAAQVAGPDVPAWLRKILARGLSLVPAKRWPDMHELLAALARDPGRARRRLAVGGLAVFVVAAAGYGAAAYRHTEAHACDAAAAELVGVWDEPQRAALDQALRATGVAYADATFLASAARLDARRDAWISARTAACAARRGAAISDTLFDRRMSCLRQRRAELASDVSVLTQATVDTVANAVATASGAAPISACDDDDRLMAAVPPPSDPTVAAAVEAVRARMAQSRSMELMGRIDEATALAEPLAREAEALGYVPLRAEVALMNGGLAMIHMHPKEALAHIEQAELLALETGASEAAADAIATRMFVLSEGEGRPADALAEGPRARALARHAGDPPGLAALLAHADATARLRLGDVAASIAGYEEALALLTTHSPDDPSRNVVSDNLVVAWQTLGRHDRAQELARPELARRIATLGACHPDVAALHLILAASERGSGDFDAAILDAESAIACYVDVFPPSALDALHVLAAVHELRDDNVEVRRQLDRAAPLLARVDSPHHQSMFDLLRAELALAERRHDEARTLLTATRDQTADDPAHLGVHVAAETDLARLALAEHDPERARDLTARALDRMPAHASQALRGLTQFTRARTLHALGDRERARQLATEAILEYEAAGRGYAARIAEIRLWLTAL